MELKLYNNVRITKTMQCSNRTFMELKLGDGATRRSGERVLIGPLWN